MKAIRSHEPSGIKGLRYEEVPDAKLMTGDVLVKVAACGITHDELDWPLWICRAGHQRTFIIPGHEVPGVVVELGPGTVSVTRVRRTRSGALLLAQVRRWRRVRR
jgi:D-arabinose 1-dehydrogenase-like Zn-dependent alcohol dehydrogenase